MKELTIEQKAKAYDEAKLRMSAAYNSNRCTIGFMNEIFPELRESEDERIRKALIDGFKRYNDGSLFNGCLVREILPWLEKQGEHNMGISEATKQKLEDNLNKALEKETPESWNKFLDEQGEPIKIKKGKNYFCVKTHNYAGVEWIEGTKYYASDNYTLVNQGCEYYCPEYSKEEHNNLFEEVKCDSCVEKQGEQKPTDKVEPKDYSSIDPHFFKPADKIEPKFKVSDWVVYEEYIYQIHNISLKKYYECLRIDGTVHTFDFEYIDSKSRLWTIQDAKDGDVLCCENGWTCIFKTLVNDETFSSYCFMDNTKWFCETGSECHSLKEEFVKAYNGKIHPATKEQRDALMKAMADAGYTFDFEKKELKKAEQTSANETPYPETLEKAIDLYYNSYGNGEGEFEHLSLEKFRDIVHTFVSDYEQKPAWSEEDENRFNNLIFLVECSDENKPTKKGFIDFINKLKSLKDRVQPKQEWSEEDKKALKVVTDVFGQYGVHLLNYPAFIHWLKTLPNRITFNPYWKPSVAQLNALSIVSKGYVSDDIEAIASLYNDLKKLMEG